LKNLIILTQSCSHLVGSIGESLEYRLEDSQE
jgi:hypothetical protein